MTPANFGHLGYSGGRSSQSPFKSQRSDRDKLIRHQLTKIDSYLDIQKLIQEVKNQNCDSYTLRQLLQKLKSYCQELMQIDSELAVMKSKNPQVGDFRLNKVEMPQILQAQLDASHLHAAELQQKLEICQNQLTVINQRFQVMEDNLNKREETVSEREAKVLQSEQRLRAWEAQLREEAEEIQKKLYESTTVGQSMIDNAKNDNSQSMTHIMIQTQTEQEANSNQKLLANMLDQKLQQIQDKEVNIVSQLQQLRLFTVQMDAREQSVQKSEQSLNEKQEQLFRAYDTLTEKIYQFERDCDDLKLRKKQVLQIEQKVKSMLQSLS